MKEMIHGEIARYKARPYAQGFHKDQESIMRRHTPLWWIQQTFRFLTSLAIKEEKIDLRLKDVETAYLYGPLDNEIYIKVPKGIELSNATGSRELKYTSIC